MFSVDVYILIRNTFKSLPTTLFSKRVLVGIFYVKAVKNDCDLNTSINVHLNMCLNIFDNS